MKSIDLIVFDLDGTLVDSKKDITDSVNYALRSLGLREKDPGVIGSFIGTGVNDLIKKSLDGADGALAEKALAAFESHYLEHLTDTTVLYGNVKKVLQMFDKKKKAIITNRISQTAVPLLRALGIYSYFLKILCADDVSCMKPSPCPLDKVISELKASKEKAIIVGDMDIDIIAGKSAGIMTCAVTYGIGKKDDILKARQDFVIDNIIKLEELIN